MCVCDCVLMTILEKVIKLARSLRICIIDYRTNSIDFQIDFSYFFVCRYNLQMLSLGI